MAKKKKKTSGPARSASAMMLDSTVRKGFKTVTTEFRL